MADGPTTRPEGEADLPVRRYVPEDRAAVMRIAAETGFFGDPVEAFTEDRRFFCDALYAYYTDLEPEHAWVATAPSEGGQDHIVGFLVGTTDTRRQRRLWAARILPGIVGRLLRGAYYLGPRARRHLWAQALGALRGEGPRVDLGAYPAHLHVNVAAPWRAHGLGTRLLSAFLDRLRALGVPGVHLQTTTRNEEALGLYEKLGFARLDARPTRVWEDVVPEPVWAVAYGLRLA